MGRIVAPLVGGIRNCLNRGEVALIDPGAASVLLLATATSADYVLRGREGPIAASMHSVEESLMPYLLPSGKAKKVAVSVALAHRCIRNRDAGRGNFDALTERALGLYLHASMLVLDHPHREISDHIELLQDQLTRVTD